MDWDPSTWCWIICGVPVAAEMTTGTFYLLMVAAGAAAAALCAHAGLGLTPQLVLAALVGGAAVCGWELKRRGRSAVLPAGVNQDVSLDIGGRVHVEAWGAEGSTRGTLTLELDKTFEERQSINAEVVRENDAAALNWGVKVLRYEIKDLTPPAAIREPGGEQAVQLKVAERAVEACRQLAQKNNTMIVPGNMSAVSALIGTAMTLMRKTPPDTAG